MSETIRRIFEQSMEQALREEKLRADKLKAGMHTIPLAHIFCRCGELLREPLVKNLLTASSQSFEKFMAFFFKLDESHEKISIITKHARIEKRPVETVLLEHLAKMEPAITLQHLIEGLKEAYLFRVIACLDMKSIQVLLNHTSSHQGSGCCSVHTSHSTPIWAGAPRLSGMKSSLPSTDHIGRVIHSPSYVKASRGIILLTFMEDGRLHGKHVKEVLEEPRGKSRRAFKVYTLSDFTQLIMEDFMKNILWLLSKVDFVVPILSEDYIHMLDDESRAISSTIDEKFAPYVARLLLADWASSFKNKKLRCFKPRNVQWPANKLIYPPFLTAVNEPSALPSILKTSKQS